MVLTKALILKGFIGATSVVVPASLMIAYRKEISSYFSPSNLTKFDQGLIDYLENGGDIQFKVIKGAEGTTDFAENDLSFSDSSPIVAQVKVNVNKDSSNVGTLTDGTNEDSKAKKAELQKLNGTGNGTAWTWICEIQFTREGSEGTNINSSYKDRILKSTNEGLFGILKSQLGSDNKESNKAIKQNFIRNCAEARGKFAGISPTNEIKTEARTINIKFNKKSGVDELIPENSSEFNKWFPESSINKTTA